MLGVALGQSPAGAWGMKPEALCPNATPNPTGAPPSRSWGTCMFPPNGAARRPPQGASALGRPCGSHSEAP